MDVLSNVVFSVDFDTTISVKENRFSEVFLFLFGIFYGYSKASMQLL